MAGELGFEPRLAESESAVLPLDDSPICQAERCKFSKALVYWPMHWAEQTVTPHYKSCLRNVLPIRIGTAGCQALRVVER